MPVSVLVAARQLRDSSSDVLPITQIGGFVFAARALVLAGMAVAEASAVVIADVTTDAFAQGLYVLVGVLASLSLLYASSALSPYVSAMLGGALFISVGSILFALLQLGGGKCVDRMVDKLLAGELRHDRNFHEVIRAIYGRHKRVALSVLLQLAGWFASGLWLWVILWTMGLHADIRTAVAIQALLEGLRSATVFIPASVGIQEAGYAALAPVFGFTPEIGLAISLLRRARDLVVAMPVLLVWQLVEGRRAYRA
jgi:putative membrane protein